MRFVKGFDILRLISDLGNTLTVGINCIALRRKHVSGNGGVDPALECRLLNCS